MKIEIISFDISEGKIKYHDDDLLLLSNKDKPKKVVPFFAEFTKNNYANADVVITLKSNIIDILIMDIEKIENKINRSTEKHELELLNRSLDFIQDEAPLCDYKFDSEERSFLESLSLISIKPTIQLEGNEEINEIIKLAIQKSNHMFFYTSGPKESHAWLMPKGSKIIDCAAKIHTDLSRGFIKGDVVSFDDYFKCYNFKECKSKGLAKEVDRDHIVQPKDIIEIRFNV